MKRQTRVLTLLEKLWTHCEFYEPTQKDEEEWSRLIESGFVRKQGKGSHGDLFAITPAGHEELSRLKSI